MGTGGEAREGAGKDAEERAARRAELQLKDAKLKQSIEECTKARRAAPA